ncbi:hypothetical protein CBL_00349 [Carabus blaptoides fortunei]
MWKNQKQKETNALVEREGESTGKKKKQKWNKYLNTKKAEDYQEHKKQREATKMEENYRKNQKLFYRTLKISKCEKQITLKQLKYKHGKVINEENEIMKRWIEHFEELLDETQTEKRTEVNESIEYEKTTSNKERGNITENEMKNALKKLKNGKAPGHDNMKPEHLKYMGGEGEQILLEIELKEEARKPTKTWKLDIEEILKWNNIGVQEAGETARNRVKWKENNFERQVFELTSLHVDGLQEYNSSSEY